MYTVIFDQDSDLVEKQALNLSHESVAGLIKNLDILRVRELASVNITDEFDPSEGCFVLEITYVSILVGATITIIS